MKPLSRRTILRGTVGGLAVAMALPWLEAMTNTTRRARADGSFPKRFGVWFFGNGVIPEQWTPAAEGAAWQPSPLMMPLSAIKQHLCVVTGTRVNTLNTTPHGSVGRLAERQRVHAGIVVSRGHLRSAHRRGCRRRHALSLARDRGAARAVRHLARRPQHAPADRARPASALQPSVR